MIATITAAGKVLAWLWPRRPPIPPPPMPVPVEIEEKSSAAAPPDLPAIAAGLRAAMRARRVMRSALFSEAPATAGQAAASAYLKTREDLMRLTGCLDRNYAELAALWVLADHGWLGILDD